MAAEAGGRASELNATFPVDTQLSTPPFFFASYGSFAQADGWLVAARDDAPWVAWQASSMI